MKRKGIIYPFLSECRSLLKYHRLAVARNGAILRSMTKTKSIFFHVPKTGGKSILEALYGIELHEGFGHAGVEFYLSVFGREKFDKFYKFAFVRNPWDRVYSGYKFAINHGFGFHQDCKLENEIGTLSFECFVKDWLQYCDLNMWTIFRPQHSFVCDAEGVMILDRVCYFEDINEEYNYLSNLFDIDVDISHVNKSTGYTSYKDVYDKEMRMIIEKLYHKDINMFGYIFNGRIQDNK
ncbi:MAG: sulfotransferase family 2 domain-containing protein [Candidatus Sedimenticola sp. (ex Thyasira tokunagai)]